MINLDVPGSVATAGKYPDIMLKKITFTNTETQSEQWSLTCWSHANRRKVIRHVL